MVRIHPDPPVNRRPGSKKAHGGRGCSSVGRAPALQAGGRRFDPVQLHQSSSRQDSRQHLSIAVATVFNAAHFAKQAKRAKRPALKAVSLFYNLEGKAYMSLMRARVR